MSAPFNPELKAYNPEPTRQATESLNGVTPANAKNYAPSPPHPQPVLPEIVKAIPSKPLAPTLRNRLLITVLPTVLIPLAIASVVGYQTVHKDATERIKLQLQNQALLASETTSYLLENAFAEITASVVDNPLVIEAARAGSQQAEADKIAQLPLEQAETLFSTTKLLRPNKTLNDYLSKVAKTRGIAELIVTEKHGFNVAYSNPTSDFAQSDEEWWQKGKSAGQWIGNPQFDQSANTFSIDLVQALKAPNSGEFLGVAKAVLPSSAFEQLANYLDHIKVAGSQQMQILNTDTGNVLQTVTPQGISDTQKVVGGEAVVQVTKALVTANQDQSSNPEAIANELKSKYALDNVRITQSTQPNGKPVLLASFIHDGKQYNLTTIPQTDWVAAISLDSGEIAAASNKLVLVFTLTFLLLAGVAIAIVLRLAQTLSTPLTSLSDTATAVASGNLDVTAQPEGTVETQTLAQTFNNLVTQVKGLLQEQKQETEQARLFKEIAASRVRTPQDLEMVFNKAVQGAQRILNADRVVIYRFYPDWRGYILSESVAPGWPQALGAKIEDACIGQELIEAYRNGRVVPTNNVFEAGFHPDHLRLMERLAIKANLVTPIIGENELFGLLIAHHCSAPHTWQQSEIYFLEQLAAQVGLCLTNVILVGQKEEEVERAMALNDITSRIRESHKIESIYDAALTGIRETLKTDRAVVYLFDENWQGSIMAESVGRGWPKALGANIADPCFADQYVEKYKRGRVKATENIYEAGLSECYLGQLEPFKVQANLVAPILAYNKLHGLLVTHQCSGPRQWQEPEINFFKQVAAQVGLSLDRLDYLAQVEQARHQAESMAQEQRQQKEALRLQLLSLLSDVEGAAQGDLTVRADVTAGEIGTVADFFNAVIESLRGIVNQVKKATSQLNTSLGENEGALYQLSMEALKQSEVTTSTLDSIQAMTSSIQEVASNARQAATVARTASTTAVSSGIAMERTVENIFMIRETVAETTKKVKRLGESSQQISKVASLIDQIALQTNLLAINAGIEAARAGEEGQGFAVVAEEVGALAARSAAATQEIEQIVINIQQETTSVVEAMEMGTFQVVEGTHLIEETKQSLGQILEVFGQIDTLVQSISTATVSQAETSQAVTKLMQEIVKVSEHTCHSTRQVSGALQETVGIAQELQASVGTFKIGEQ